MTTQYVALKYVNDGPKHQYLGLVTDGNYQGCLQYYVPVNDPTAKFALEPATKAGYVHIRSCYNNKYWVRSSQNDYWINATAASIEEDTTLWNCTMFEPKTVQYQGQTALQLTHVQVNKPIGLPPSSSAQKFCLCLPPTSTGTAALSFNVDYSNFAFLPPKVSFSQVIDGKTTYLGVGKCVADYPYLAVENDDPADVDVTNDVIITDDGYIAFLNAQTGGYWFTSEPGESNWVTPGSTNYPPIADTMFWVDQVSSNVVALRSKGSNQYCQRMDYSQLQVKNGLFACASTMLKETQFIVSEPVLKRTISTTFRMDDARVYGEHPIMLAQSEATNTRKSSMSMKVGFDYTLTQSYTWNNSISLKIGIEASFDSGIPFIAEGKVTMTTEFSEEYSWGQTMEESQTLHSETEVDVPAETTLMVKMMATKGLCDVPFSYTQTDKLVNGDIVTTTLYDGIYTGINAYSFYYTNE